MLQAAVPICLEVVEADRHKFQVEVLDRVSLLLSTVEAKKRANLSAHEAELSTMTAQQVTAAGEACGKKDVAESKKGHCDEKGKVVDGVREVSDGAKKGLADAHAAQEAFDAKKAGLTEEQDNFAKLLAETFQPLKEGTMGGNWQTRNKASATLKKKLCELGAQDSLGDALAATLKMSPEKREGTFAKATMEFAQQEFNKHTAKVAQDIAGLDAEAASHVAAIAAAEANAAEKKAALEAEVKEYDAMQDVWVTYDAEAAAAARELKQIEARIPKVEKNIDKAKDALEKFLEVPALFAVLKEKSTAAPAEEAVEEEAAAEEEVGEVEQADVAMEA